MQSKHELRRTLLALRTAMADDQRLLLDRRIMEKVLAWWAETRASIVAVYWPMRGEPDLHDAYASLHAQGVQLALPVVTGAEAPLSFRAWAPGEAVTRDQFGAAVPPLSNASVQPAALLIPCVGFNPQCFRLGYGGGFYDRTLALAPRPQAIGIAYATGAADFAPQQYDIALDRIITEETVLSRR